MSVTSIKTSKMKRSSLDAKYTKRLVDIGLEGEIQRKICKVVNCQATGTGPGPGPGPGIGYWGLGLGSRDGEWGMGNGKWEMGKWEWEIENGK